MARPGWLAGTQCASIRPIGVGAADLAGMGVRWARALAKYDQAAAQCQAGASSQDGLAIQRAGADLSQGNADLARTTRAIKALSGS